MLLLRAVTFNSLAIIAYTFAVIVKKMNIMNLKALTIKFKKFKTIIKFKRFERYNCGVYMP